jgi:hypothetical protein
MPPTVRRVRWLYFRTQKTFTLHKSITNEGTVHKRDQDVHLASPRTFTFVKTGDPPLMGFMKTVTVKQQNRNICARCDYRSRGPGFDSRALPKKKVVSLEWGPLSLVSTTEELLDRKVAAPCLENREYGHRDPSCLPRGTLYPQKLVITSPTSGGRSVGIVRSRTQTTEFSFSFS